MQVPYHSERAVAALEKFIVATEPEVICVGDEMDMPTVSRWTKGSAFEFQPIIGKQRDATVTVMERLRVRHVMRSNHTDRLQNYLRKYAPALAGLPELELAEFMRYPDLGIELHDDIWEFAPGWVLCHGDEGSMIRSAGGTALGIARKIGKSVVAGHTHKLGLQAHTEMIGGRVTRTLWGCESGHLMDPKKAGYLKAGSASWQAGFAMFYVEGKLVQPVPVPMLPNGSFHLEGRVWTA